MRLLCVVLTCALVACQHKSPDDKVKDTAKTAASWAASLSFGGHQWVANSVPKRYIRTAADAAKKGLDKSEQDVAGSEASKVLRNRIGHDIAEAERLVTELDDAVEKSDRSRASAAATQLDRIAKDLQQ
jgi:hypothetical protein